MIDPADGVETPSLGGRIRPVRNAVFYPLRRGDRRPFSMGVRCADGRPLPESVLIRGWDTIAEPPPPVESPAVSDRAVIYGGVLFGHYGHFLLETLAFSWAGRERPDLPLAWTGWRPRLGAAGAWIRRRFGWRQELMALLRLRNEQILVSRPTRFDTVLVPERGLKMYSHIEPWFAERLAVFPGRPSNGRRIWLSRSSLSSQAPGFDNEREIEAVLAGKGWTIFHPQRHSLQVQLDTLARADRIAGVEGSAFHTLLLLQKVRATIDMFMRSEVLVPTFHAIAAVKGISQRAQFVRLDTLSGEGRMVRSRVKPADVLAALEQD